MKKVTLLLFMLIMSVSGYSQLANESFESWPPAGWGIVDLAGPQYTWQQSQLGNDQQPPHTGDYAAFLNRENVTSGTSEDWLITKQFPAPANAQLRFWSKLTLGGNQGSIYEIRVSTNPIQTNTTAFNPPVVTWTETQLNPSNDYTEKVVSLTGIPAGTPIYVAFIMKGDQMERWLIDDVRVVEQCVNPVAQIPTSVTFNSATLTWTNPGGATQWEIEVVPVADPFTGVGVIYNGLPPYTVTPLLPGTNYKYRVRAICTTDNKSDWSNVINFSTSFQPPVNDACANAIGLTVSPTNICAINTPGTVNAATASPEASTCTGTEDDDVWYTFVATGPTHLVNLLSVTGSTTDLVHAVYSGTGCGALTQMYCSDPNSSTATGLVAGNTYFVRVYSWSATAQTTNFTICIGTPPPPPVNDECAGAITAPVNPDLVCAAFVTGTVYSATASPDANTCTGTDDDDVWYTFMATNTSHTINLNNITGSTTNLNHVLYSGGCGALTQLYCSDPNNSIAGNLTPGEMYTIRIYSSVATAQTSVFDLCIGTPPPPPVNDNCSTATVAPVNPNLLCGQVTAGTIAWSTPSIEGSTCTGTEDDDVWYEFVATSTSHTISLLNVTGSVTDMAHVLYSGDQCGTLTQLYCSDPDSSIAGGLVIGQTYKVRVYSYTATPGQTTTFNLCIGTPPPPPANDNCADAIVAPVNPTQVCAQTVAGTIAWATPSVEGSTCAGTEDDDVWYVFTATNTTHLISLLNVAGSVTDMMHAVYSGNSCGALTQVYCSDPNNSTATNLVVGQTYYVRVYTYTGTGGQNTTFNLCIGTPPPPPANDECATAIVAPVNPTHICAATVPGIIYSATASPEANGCTGTADDDVWFEFTATNTTHLINLNDILGSTTNLNHVVYSGACGALTQLYCSDPNNSTAQNLVVGETYRIRVYSSVATPQTSTFTLCIGTPPPPPVNDECANAIVAPVNDNSLCTETTLGTVYSASASPQANGCTGTADDDVWYEFTATHTQHYIALLNEAGTGLNGGNMVHAVYTGDCGSLTQVYCSDPNNSIANNLVVGQTYKIRIYSNVATPQTFTFRLCIGVILTCADSESFCANAEQEGVTFPGSLGVPNLGAVSCLLTTPNPTYYFLQIETNGNLQMNISQTSFAGNPIDVDFIAYGPFPSLDAGCANLTVANEVDCSYSPAAVEPFTIPNAVAGDYYVVLITNFNGQQGTINFTQPNFGNPGAGTTDCTIVCTADLGPDQVLCGVAEYDIDSNIINATSYTWYKDGVVIPGATAQTYTVTESGVYSVTVVKAACATNPTDSVNITLLPAIDVPNPANVVLCGDLGTSSIDLTTLSAGILGTLDPTAYIVKYYLTQPNATSASNQIDTSVPFVTTTQTIYVRVESTLLNTCFDVVPLNIVVNASANADISYAGSPYCSNESTGTVTQTGDTGGTYTSTAGLVIDPATGTIDIAASTPGTYTVTYTIAATAFCPVFTDNTQVIIVEAPTASIAYANSPYCSNSTTATVTQTGAAGGIYSSTAGLTIDAATGEIDLTASTPGSYTVTYTIPATADCTSSTVTAPVTITTLPVAGISYNGTPYCTNGGTASVTQIGATGGTYTSTAGLTIDPATGAINPATSTPGTYTVTYTVPAGSGCPAVPATATVIINLLPEAGFIYDAASFCRNVGSIATPAFEGAAVAGTFTVDVAGLTIDPATGAINPATSTPGVYVVTNTIAASGGCGEVTSSETVTIIDAPIATFTYAGPYCQEGATDPSPSLDGVAGTFSATPAGLSINASTGMIDLSASQPGTYTVTNTVAATPQCDQVSEITTVVINATPVFNLGGPYEVCAASSATITVDADNFDTATATYAWTLNGVATADTGSTVTAAGFGEYGVTVTTADGCVATQTITVVQETDGVEFAFVDECDDENVYNLSVAAVGGSFDPEDAMFTWTGPAGFTNPAPGVGVSSVIPTATGTYTVSFVTPQGCIGTDSFIVDSTSCFIQKGISPGDGDKNNTFDLTALNVKTLSIFNRYGQEVYSLSNYTNQWGGQDKSGNELPTGTYFYSLERANGETMTGWVYINRQN